MLDYKISVIVNPEGQARDFGHKVHNSIQDRVVEFGGREEDVELNRLEVQYFPDGEFLPRITGNCRRRNCVYIHDSNLHPGVWFTQLDFVNDALKGSSIHEKLICIPYFDFSRQDNPQRSREPTSAKDVAKIINDSHTKGLTMDVHNDTIRGFFDIPFFSLPIFPTLHEYLEKNYPKILENLVVVGADQTALKRNKNRKHINRYGYDIAIIDKDRKITGDLGESLGVLGADRIPGKDVLLLDDMGATGGSLIDGSKAVKNAGAREVYAWVTHGLFTEGYEKIKDHFDIIFIGNTIKQPLVPGEGIRITKYALKGFPEEIRSQLPNKEYVFLSDILRLQPPYRDFKLPDNVKTISLEDRYGDAIFRICTDQSLSEIID